MFDSHELAWAAGLFDGEGSIVITLIDSRTGSCVVTVSIEMTCELTIRRFARIFGDTGCEIRLQKPRDPKHKPSWKYYAHGHVGVNLIKLLQPYLVTKKGQADLLVEFGERCMAENYTRNNPIPEDVCILRQVIRLEIKELNKRGV